VLSDLPKGTPAGDGGHRQQQPKAPAASESGEGTLNSGIINISYN